MTGPLDQLRTELGTVMAGVAPGLPAANELCSACVSLLGVDGAAISMIHDGESRGTFGSSSEASRRLDEYQFTFGEGPCLDAVATAKPVLVPDLDSPNERRWPAFTGAVVGDGIRAVFAVPIMMASACVGALDLFRKAPGPLATVSLDHARVAAEFASIPLLDLTDLSAEAESEDPGAGWSSSDLDRIEVYQATGVLISQLDVDPAEALLRLRAHAIATGRTASEVAWAILERSLVLERDDGRDGRSRS